jgi:hypothetical protein
MNYLTKFHWKKLRSTITFRQQLAGPVQARLAAHRRNRESLAPMAERWWRPANQAISDAGQWGGGSGRSMGRQRNGFEATGQRNSHWMASPWCCAMTEGAHWR